MELQQFYSSLRVRTQYLKALAKLSERLNETWKRIFPPDAWWPRETCEAFFEPFDEFGVALYDAYAQELLNSTPSHEHYLQVLNFDLKTLVLNQIYPYREKPIRTAQDVLDADERGELPGEWTVRMGEAWRLFEHPRHNAVQDQVCHEFINVYGYMPELWNQLIGRISKAMSRRGVHWLAAHAEAGETARASDVGCESTGAASEHSASIPSGKDPARKRGRPQIIPDEMHGSVEWINPEKYHGADVSEPASNVVAPEGRTEAEVESAPRKKRGRPTEIPDERKQRALSVRGGKARAQILYETKYPTPQQVKNVSSILRHYRVRSTVTR